MPYLLKKLRFRFSVLTLLAATTILGVLLGLVANEANRLRLHRQVDRKIHELGGRLISVADNEYGECWGPPWCPVVRDGLYADFEYVWFTSTRNAGLRDEDLAVLKHLPRLRDLQIVAPLITDEAMIHVEGIKSLRELELYETQVTRLGLRRLRCVPLEKLVLTGPDVTDETLEALEDFPGLRKLMICESAVTDAGLAHLRHVPNLENLILTDSPISDGLSPLTKLTRLYELELRGLPITDDGISPLAALERLQFLNVAQTRVTATGLLAFRNNRTLKYLFIGEQSSSDNLNTLTSGLHGCQVIDSSGIRCMQGW